MSFLPVLIPRRLGKWLTLVICTGQKTDLNLGRVTEYNYWSFPRFPQSMHSSIPSAVTAAFFYTVVNFQSNIRLCAILTIKNRL